MNLIDAFHQVFARYSEFDFSLHRIVPVRDIFDSLDPCALLAKNDQVDSEFLRKPDFPHEAPGIVGQIVGKLTQIVLAIDTKPRIVEIHVIADNKF